MSKKNRADNSTPASGGHETENPLTEVLEAEKLQTDKLKAKLAEGSVGEVDYEVIERVFSVDVGMEKDEFPLLDVPHSLHKKLYAIPEQGPRAFIGKLIVGKVPMGKLSACLSAAAVLVIGLAVSNIYFSQPSPSELLRAKRELAIAFQYLNGANQTTNQKVRETVYVNIQRASVVSVFDSLNLDKESPEEEI